MDDIQYLIINYTGFNAWCNGAVSKPWKKMTHGLTQFSDIISCHKSKQDKDHIVTDLMTLLNDRTP